MVNRDKTGSFTIEQLKRQYNLDNKKVLQAIEQQSQNLIKVENELDDYIKVATKEMELIQNQVDGNITTWFFDGVPTLDNKPATDWTTEESKTNHLGDLYYDSLTGYAYRFSLENEEFLWHKLTDSDITEALALANVAKDTADSKRRVFLNQPIPPYDSGDFWINNDELYICQVSKETGEYEENDFIDSLKYTDDTYAKQVENELTIVSGKVTTIEEGIDEIKTTIEENKYFVDSEGNEQLISESMSEVKQTLDSVEVSIEDFKTNVEENYSTTSDLEQLKIDLENGVTNTFSTSGGSNLIRNSALLFEESEGIFEYWDGSVKRNDEENSSETGTALLIQKNKCSQKIEALVGEYYLSFKYKKLIELSTLSVFLNGVEYQLIPENDESAINEIQEYELSFGIDNPNITIEFVSNTDNGVEIYDLMLNKGSIKAMYSQHQNEITTNTVRIGKGLQVESTSTNTITKIDSDGQRTLNKTTNEIVNKNTDTGTYTKTLEVEEQAKINKLFIQEVDEQVWITGL